MMRAKRLAWSVAWGMVAWGVMAMSGWVAGGPLANPPADAGGKRENEPLKKRVDEGMRKGVDFLLGNQKGERYWESQKRWDGMAHVGGETALALYALLRTGQSVDDPRLRGQSGELAGAVGYVTGMKAETNYVAACRGLALMQLPLRAESRQALADCREQMLRSMVAGEAEGSGAFTYSPEHRAKNGQAWDNCNTQFAQMALGAMSEGKIEIPEGFWKNAERHWRTMQLKDGGWAYEGGAKESAKTSKAMTAAGIASLCESMDRQLAGGGSWATGGKDAVLTAGKARMGADFQAESGDFFYLWAVQRAVAETGQRFVGKKDALRGMAENLLARQREDGSWKSAFNDGGMSGENPNVATSYALLILAAVRDPVLLARWEYAVEGKEGAGQGKAHARDLARVTGATAKLMGRTAMWESVDDQRTVEEISDARILVIRGVKDPGFTEKQVQTLRGFVEGGGVIFSYAAGGTEGKEFSEAVLKKYAAVVGGGKYAMRELEGTEALMLAAGMGKEENAGKNAGKLWGLSNGVRELWVHTREDAGAAWEAGNSGKNAEMYQVAMGLETYVTGRLGLRGRLENFVPEAKKTSARTVKVGRVEWRGNWDPEAGAWQRMAGLGAAEFRTRIEVVNRKGEALDAQETPLAHLTGTGELKLTEAEAAGLQAYVAGGGLLCVDAAGGDKVFAESFEAWARKLWPETPLSGLLANDPIYNGGLKDAVKIAKVEYRKGMKAEPRRGKGPALQGITRGGRHGVIFSEDDLTAGMAGVECLGIVGYSSADAVRVMRNVVVYAGR